MVEITFWNQFFVWPIINLLMVFYKAFEAIDVPGPLGFAVIALTITIRLLLYPLTRAQLRSAKQMAGLKPHLDVLSTRHKGDKPALQKAQMDLYKQHGVNPAAGCLPLLIQMPVLIALYNVFYQVLQNGNIEKLITDINQVVYHQALHLQSFDLNFFGVSLGLKPSSWQTNGWWLLAIPVITAALQFWQSKLMMPPPSATVNSKQLTIDKKQKDKKSDGKIEEPKVDTAAEMQKQMMLITPIMFGMFAFQFPLGLSLYWNVFGLFGIMQQLRVNKE